jgi:hypothetical protein
MKPTRAYACFCIFRADIRFCSELVIRWYWSAKFLNWLVAQNYSTAMINGKPLLSYSIDTTIARTTDTDQICFCFLRADPQFCISLGIWQHRSAAFPSWLAQHISRATTMINGQPFLLSCSIVTTIARTTDADRSLIFCLQDEPQSFASNWEFGDVEL